MLMLGPWRAPAAANSIAGSGGGDIYPGAPGGDHTREHRLWEDHPGPTVHPGQHDRCREWGTLQYCGYTGEGGGEGEYMS